MIGVVGGTLYSDALTPAGQPGDSSIGLFRYNAPALAAAMLKNRPDLRSGMNAETTLETRLAAVASLPPDQQTPSGSLCAGAARIGLGQSAGAIPHLYRCATD